MEHPPVVSQSLEGLALVFSELDALPLSTSDPEGLTLAAEDCEFYGKELVGLAVRLRDAARTAGARLAV